MLVVPDSRYSQHIPALIGTNILDNLMYHLQKEHGVRYLQNAALTTHSSVVSVDISLCSAKSVDCIIEGVDLYGISLSKYPSASIELLGYIEANIKMPGDTNTTCQHVMLVVPDSRYSQHIPALIGTNILDNLMYHLQEEHGVRYLQNAALTTPWFLTFRCV
jgi:hypothetical protein